MSYQVLARKWRPQNFRQLAGQNHVLQALVNALDSKRLHHAYLFTGTRGVGKTTIARILAKCLNCETGISSQPCEQCNACREITEGRFVDLIEIDAASRTKVEDTREILDNVQYMPARGRFKIYLIDEVHMLSTSSFNALLKTLEEPPAHVKFLLATTDPHKLPITVLSRCLQFNLKNLNPEKIVEHLTHVLAQEMIPAETDALWQLARAADGSMRDALSLTDQAIAYGAEKITSDTVAQMLGSMDRRLIQPLLDALIAGNAEQLLAQVAVLAEQNPDYAGALTELLSLLHQVAVVQAAPAYANVNPDSAERLQYLAQAMSAEDVQLYYQIGINSQRDLALAPDLRAGFEMALLRMLAFRPASVLPEGIEIALPPSGSASISSSTPTAAPAPVVTAQAAVAPAHVQTTPTAAQSTNAPAIHATTPVQPAIAAPTPAAIAPTAEVQSVQTAAAIAPSEQVAARHLQEQEPPPWATEDIYTANSPVNAPVQQTQTPVPTAPTLAVAEASPAPVVPTAAPAVPAATESKAHSALASFEETAPMAPTADLDLAPLATTSDEPLNTEPKILNSDTWPQLWQALPLAGVVRNTVSHCSLERLEGKQARFVLDRNNAALFDPSHSQRLQMGLNAYLNDNFVVSIEVGEPTQLTPARAQQLKKAQQQQAAEEAFLAEPQVQWLMQAFDASVVPNSIKPQ